MSYASVTSPIAAGDPLPAFRDFCSSHRERLLNRMRTGGTQTNDVRRGAALAIGLHYLQTRLSKPLVLVELGASAGLLILFDRYRINVGGRVLGPEDSPVDVPVAADTHMLALLPPEMPPVAGRVGVDLAPVDLGDPAQVRWLEAFVWPEAHDDRDRLRAAVTIARTDPLVVQGDAVTLLPTILDSISEAYAPVVFHSTLLTYLTARQRQAIAECLETVGSRRELGWLPLEAPGFLAAIQPAFQIPAALATQTPSSCSQRTGGKKPYRRVRHWLRPMRTDAPCTESTARRGRPSSATPCPATRRRPVCDGKLLFDPA